MRCAQQLRRHAVSEPPVGARPRNEEACHDAQPPSNRAHGTEPASYRSGAEQSDAAEAGKDMRLVRDRKEPLVCVPVGEQEGGTTASD